MMKIRQLKNRNKAQRFIIILLIIYGKWAWLMILLIKKTKNYQSYKNFLAVLIFPILKIINQKNIKYHNFLQILIPHYFLESKQIKWLPLIAKLMSKTEKYQSTSYLLMTYITIYYFYDSTIFIFFEKWKITLFENS